MTDMTIDAHWLVPIMRYSMGRMTYASGDAGNLVWQHADKVNPSTREALIREISEWLEKVDRNAPGRCAEDIDPWIKALKRLKENDTDG